MTSDNHPSETLFPFNCDNCNCAAVYDAKGFHNVALLWGYICLASGKDNFIGITCPKCHQTTVRRYGLPSQFLDPDDFDSLGAYRDPHGDIHLLADQVVVPFSPNILRKSAGHLGLNIPEIATTETVKFSLPAPIRINPLSMRVVPGKAQPWFVGESQIDDLCRFENSHGFKIIPRINRRGGLYSLTDIWLGHDSLNSLRGIAVNSKAWEIPDNPDPTPIMNIERVLCEFTTQGQYAGLPIKSSLSPQELEKIRFSPEIDNSTNRAVDAHIRDFLLEYHLVRNKLNFEISFRSGFLDKHVQKIFAINMELDEASYYETCHAIEVSAAECELVGLVGGTPEEGIDAARIASSKKSAYTESDNYFIHEGASWRVQFNGKSTTINNSKRLIYLLLLLDKPDHMYNNKALQLDADAKHRVALKPTGPTLADRYGEDRVEMVDDAADNGELTQKGNESDVYQEKSPVNLKDYKKALIELVGDLESLEQLRHSREEIESQEEQIDHLKSILRKEHGISFKFKKQPSGAYKCAFSEGKARLTDDAERARKNLWANIANVFKDLHAFDPELSSYLDQCIQVKQSFSIYNPDLHANLKHVRFYIEW